MMQHHSFGFGRVLVKLVNNIKRYKAEFFPKVQFKPFVTDGKTKGDGIEFQTPSVEGTIFSKAETIDGKTKMIWERHKTFDTDEEAQAYLDDLMKAPTTQVNAQTQNLPEEEEN